MKDAVVHSRRGQGTTLIELLVGDETRAAGLEILDLQMCLSGVKVPTGGISAVYCEPDYRNHGYAQQCMVHAIELQREEGKLLSFLFGVPNFYERLGYTVVMPWYGVYVSPQAWQNLPAEPEMREPAPHHKQTLLDLYHKAVGMRCGPVVRTTERSIKPRRSVKWWTHGLLRILLGPQEQVRGYVWHSEAGEADFEVVEACATDDASYEQMLAYLLHETTRRGKPHFIAALPPDEPFSLFLKRYEAKFVVTTRASGGGMARILKLEELCRTVGPAFQRQCKELRHDFVPRHIVLSTEDSQAIIELEGAGPPAKLEVPSTLLTKLLFGYITLAEAVRCGATCRIPREIGRQIFPLAYPFMYLRDRF